MIDVPKPPFEVPPDVRAIAERSIAEAKAAFDRLLDAAKSGIGAAEGQSRAVQDSARDVGTTVIAFAEKNVAATFDYAQKLMQAKDPQTLMQIQVDFIRTQMQGLSEQAKVLGETVTKAATSTIPKK